MWAAQFCIRASVHHCISASEHHCISASDHQCIGASVHQSIGASVHQSIIASMHQTIRASVHQSIGASHGQKCNTFCGHEQLFLQFTCHDVVTVIYTTTSYKKLAKSAILDRGSTIATIKLNFHEYRILIFKLLRNEISKIT